LLPYYGVLVQIARLLTLSTALNLVHRNSFPNFHIFHNILLNFANFRGRPLSKSMQIPEKESKPSEIACKQSEPVRTVCKIEKRREFVRALWNEQRIARRILSKGSTLLRGCWFWSEKLRFRKNFDENFNAVERVRELTSLFERYLTYGDDSRID